MLQARSRVGCTDSDDVWWSMIHSSRFTDEQKSAIVALRGFYLRNLGLLSRRRQELTTLLQVPTLEGPASHLRESNVVYELLCVSTAVVCHLHAKLLLAGWLAVCICRCLCLCVSACVCARVRLQEDKRARVHTMKASEQY